jgi:predicted dehydrogenase
MIKIGLIDNESDSGVYADAINRSRDFSLSGLYHLPPAESTGENIQTDISRLKEYREFLNISEALIFPRITSEVHNLIILALKHSKHILAGNPLNLDFESVDHLFKLSEEANVIFKVIQTVQYHSAMQAALEYIRNPVLLEIRNESADSLEPLIDSIHKCVQPAVFINQTGMKKVQAVSIPLNNGLPDVINARIEFNNGCVANVTSSRYAKSDRFICRVHQANQHIDIDFATCQVSFTGFEDSKLNLSSSQINVSGNQPMDDELSGFAENILTNNFHLNQSQSGYQAYFISRKILEKICYELYPA